MLEVIDLEVESYQESAIRMSLFIDSSGKSQSDIARITGLAPATLSRIAKGKQVMGKNVIDTIVKHFDVNAQWLETGEGEMGSAKERAPHHLSWKADTLNEASPVDLVDETEVSYNSKGIEFRELENGMVLMTITLVPEFAYASYPHGWRDPEYLVELPKYSIVLPRREQGFFRAFEVRGDSMDDGTKYSISHGDVAIGRRIEPDLWNQKLYNNGGTDFIIVTHDGVICKRIIGHDIPQGVITCASRNPNKTEFPNFPIRLSEVYELYKIRKVDRDWNHR
ncbi:hypothetical protein BN8_03695 [Fibrisoma limi BUZ 3]|uniref:HTH cro/C1-type domain-containing protein n=1 Tax=Fibrisoma limi BUZ 3 TaxID=1185876 RepID=I2GKU0_9BACT|nr:hypothetical protein [Fibrisoma limi]CCH54516.1 hypothetical protein BN8_03695 [Fibrisoma limi BUZ 3]